MPTASAPDLHIYLNAFNQKTNPQYLYQATDIRLIQREIMKPHLSNFVVHEPIGDDVAIDKTLKSLIESLDANKPALCIYNLGDWHWVTFAALKIKDKNCILYKDSHGKSCERLEKQIKDINPLSEFVFSCTDEQTHKQKGQPPSLDCGIFALQNMEIMAIEITNKKEAFIAGFKDYNGFCKLESARALRSEGFPEKYVVGKYQEMVDEAIKLDQLKQLRKHHDSEVTEIASKFGKLNFFQKFNVIPLLHSSELPDEFVENTISIIIDTDKGATPGNYIYSYRIALSYNLYEHEKELLQAISRELHIDKDKCDVCTVPKQGTEYNRLVIKISSKDVQSIPKAEKDLVESDCSPIKISELLDNLFIEHTSSSRDEVLKTLSNHASNIDNDIPNEDPSNAPQDEKKDDEQHEIKAGGPKKLDFGDAKKLSPEERYQREGDDSSDEDVEHEIYHKPIDLERYSGDAGRTAIRITYHRPDSKKYDAALLEKICEQVFETPAASTPKSGLAYSELAMERRKEFFNKTQDSPEKKTVSALVCDGFSSKKKGHNAKNKEELIKAAIERMLPSPKSGDGGDGKFLNLKWSLIFTELGDRLLISDKVRKLYFPSKISTMGAFAALDDKVITDLLKTVVDSTLKDYNAQSALESILQDFAFIDFHKEFLSDKRKICLLDLDVLKPDADLNQEKKILKQKIAGLTKLMTTRLPSNQTSDAVEEVYIRRIEDAVTKLYTEAPNFKTPTGKLADSANSKKEKEAYLAKYPTNQYRKIVCEAIKTSSSLDKAALTKYVKAMFRDQQKDHQQVIDTNFVTDLFVELEKFKATIIRPTLPDGTSFSFKELASKYEGADVFFCHLRLSHCSVKRSIKNIKYAEDKDFEGIEFMRSWRFDSDKSLAVIEQKSLSKNCSLTTMVHYPSNSSYGALATRFEDFKTKDGKIDGLAIVGCIKSMLQTGHLPKETQISAAFERFLTTFTYHFFGVEVERHHAAAIHHAMALDLFAIKGFSYLVNLPMSLEAAVPIVREIQTSLRTQLSIPYRYDADRDPKNIKTLDSEELQRFIYLEEKLAFDWMDAQNPPLPHEFNHDVLRAIDDLCDRVYGIKLMAEECPPLPPLE